MSGQMQGQVYSGPVERMDSGVGAAVTAVTTAAQHVTIAIPAGKGGTLTEVIIVVKDDLETVVNGGGHVRLWNSSTDWIPFEFFTPGSTQLTDGAVMMRPYVFKCSKYLPGNSSVYVDYTPYDDQSQFLEVSLKYTLGPKPREETFSLTNDNGEWKKAAAITSTARNNWGVIAIPGAKGGTLVALAVHYFPTLEDVIAPGGGALCDWTVDSHDLLPMDMHTETSQADTGGGLTICPTIYPLKDVCLANSNYTIYGTSNDDQSHNVGGMVMWKRPYRG